MKYTPKPPALSDRPYFWTFNAKALHTYLVKVSICTWNTEAVPINSCLMQFSFDNCLLLDKELSQNNLSVSSDVGYYRYIPVSNDRDSVFEFKITIPDRINTLEIGLRTWKNKTDIFLTNDVSVTDISHKPLTKFKLNHIVDTTINKSSVDLNTSKTQNVDHYCNKNDLYKLRARIENTLSFRVGNLLINSTRSLSSFLLLPINLYRTIKNHNNKFKIYEPPNILPKLLPKKNVSINKIQAISILDEISENCWGNVIRLYPIEKINYINQIRTSKSHFAFLESAWNANRKDWIYAFTSPKLNHQNSKLLIHSIDLLKEKQIPIVFWNKEDPMHYDLFLPIAKKADYIFTTDSNMVQRYIHDTGNLNVKALSFAAPISEANPINRFINKTESVCFSGTYYTLNHEDRRTQMEVILPAILENNGVIYDRSSGDKSGNYCFPKKYNDYIRNAVNYNEMVQIYKKFRVFLNVNTISNSPTMMSRRIYELLACGTPVVSTPSKSLMKEFPGIVLTVKNEEEANLAVNKLLTDHSFWYKISHQGYRQVMLNHTYNHRINDILRSLNMLTVNSNKKVAVIYNISSKSHIKECVQTLLNQKYKSFDLFLVCNFQDTNNIQNTFSIYDIDNSIRIDKTIYKSNRDAINSLKENYKYGVFLSDNNIYFRNYIQDILIPFMFSNAVAIGKNAFYSYDHNNIELLHKENIHTYTKKLSLHNTAIDLTCINDINLTNDMTIETNSNDTKLYSADQFNFLELPTNNIENISDLIYFHETEVGI